MGARRAGIRTIIVPEENLPQLSELPKKLTDGLALVPVRNMDEVIEYGLGAVASVLSEADESATLPAAHVCRPAA